MRFIDSEWNIQQKLVKLEIVAKSMNAEELALRLIQCLAVEHGTSTKPASSSNEAGLH